jgi:hypothetical protein
LKHKEIKKVIIHPSSLRSNIMKKLLVVALLLTTVFVVSVAQNTATANAAITLTVNAAITATNTAPLALGNVVAGTSGGKTIASTATGAAAFTVVGTPSTATSCTFLYPTNLISGSNVLTFNQQIPVYNTTNVAGSQAAATAFSAASGGSGILTSGTGQLYLWVGGGVSPLVTQPAGAYTGTITVTVTQ